MRADAETNMRKRTFSRACWFVWRAKIHIRPFQVPVFTIITPLKGCTAFAWSHSLAPQLRTSTTNDEQPPGRAVAQGAAACASGAAAGVHAGEQDLVDADPHPHRLAAGAAAIRRQSGTLAWVSAEE